ncbi:MAG: PilZ domain-containing protein [Spirochaetaceae bacterium]|nr:MAG: PilZ domain-containing protein [Spirochaetaceae bacterium]
MGEDKRRYPRRSLDVKVNYDFRAYAHAKDISYGGICLITDRKLEENKMFTLQFFLPGDAEPMALHGKIAWIRSVGEHHYENGISFWRVDEETEKRLVEYLKQSPLKD